jgi:hypothetical protein
MPRFRHITNSLVAGEISPRAQGRTELPLYNQACKKLENFVVESSGGATRRAGTQFLTSTNRFDIQAETTDVSHSDKLIPFVFSEDETYVARISQSGGDITMHNVSTGVQTLITSYLDDWDGAADFWEWLEEGDVADVSLYDEMQWAQTGDLLYIVHPDVAPFIIARTATDTFEVRQFYRNGNLDEALPQEEFERWPYRDKNRGATTLTLAAGTHTAGNAVSITSSPAIFHPGMEGAPWKIFKSDNSVGGVAVLKTVGAGPYPTATASFQIVEDLTAVSTVATTHWYESAWSNYRGWPRSITFHDSRLYYGGNTHDPDEIWASGTFNPVHMNQVSLTIPTPELTNDEPFSFNVSSGEPNQIQWLSSGKALSVGTKAREYQVISSKADTILSANAIAIQSETGFGSSNVQPVRMSNKLLFVPKAGQRVREFSFNFDADAYQANDASLLADHMLERSMDLRGVDRDPKIVQIALQQGERSVLWVRDSNRNLYAMSRDIENGVTAWHFHTLGGKFFAHNTNTTRSIALPSADVDQTLDVITILNHGFANGDRIRYQVASGAAITGLVDITMYFIVSATADTFQLSLTSGGAAIDLTGGGSGVSNFTKYEVETPMVDSICVVPSPTGEGDEVWISCLRNNGADTFTNDFQIINCIEKIGVPFKKKDLTDNNTSIDKKPVFVDSAEYQTLGVDDRKRLSFTGFDHLADQAVDILADGIYVSGKTVSFGQNRVNNGDAETGDLTGWEAFVGPTQSSASYVANTTDHTVDFLGGFRDKAFINYVSGNITGLTPGNDYWIKRFSGDNYRFYNNLTDSIHVLLTSTGSGTQVFEELTPADGTGGIPNITFQVNNTLPVSPAGPIADSWDFEIDTATAATNDKQGISQSIAITSSDQNKMMTLRFKHTHQNSTTPVFYACIIDEANQSLCEIESANAGAGVIDDNVKFVLATGVDKQQNEIKFNMIGSAAPTSTLRLCFYTENALGGTAQYYIDDIEIDDIGTIVLDTAAKEVVVGHPYTSTATLPPLSAGSAIGTSIGAVQRLDEVTIKLARTVGGKLGRDETNIDEFFFEPGDLPITALHEMFNGDKTIKFPADYSRETNVTVVQDRGLPMTIVSISSRGKTSD